MGFAAAVAGNAACVTPAGYFTVHGIEDCMYRAVGTGPVTVQAGGCLLGIDAQAEKRCCYYQCEKQRKSPDVFQQDYSVLKSVSLP